MAFVHIEKCSLCGCDMGLENMDLYCADCETKVCECGRKLSHNNKTGVCIVCQGRKPIPEEDYLELTPYSAYGMMNPENIYN